MNRVRMQLLREAGFTKGSLAARLGVRLGLFFLPIVAFGGYTVMLVSPGLSLIRLANGWK